MAVVARIAADCRRSGRTLAVRTHHDRPNVRHPYEEGDAVRARRRRSRPGDAATCASGARFDQRCRSRRIEWRVMSTATPVPETRDLDGDDARTARRECGTWQLLKD